MWDAEKKRIIDRYNERIAREGLQFSALASGTEERREMRFKILTEIGIQSGDSVLDLGCGFGDFSVYLDRRGLDIDYTGYDINPKLIGEAQRRHPQRRFEERDILQESFPDFDYVVSSSCFNLRMIDDDNYDFVRRIMTNSYAHARKGVTIDFLSSYVDYQSVEGFHYQPETIFRFAKALTKRVCIRHDYPLFEFNVYLRREFQGWGHPG